MGIVPHVNKPRRLVGGHINQVSCLAAHTRTPPVGFEFCGAPMALEPSWTRVPGGGGAAKEVSSTSVPG